MCKADPGAASAYVSPTSYLQVQRGASLFISFSPDLSHTEYCVAVGRHQIALKSPKTKPKHKPKKPHNWIFKISSHTHPDLAQIQVSEVLMTGCVSLASGQAGFMPRGWHWGAGTRNLGWFPAQQPLSWYVCAQTSRSAHAHVLNRDL